MGMLAGMIMTVQVIVIYIDYIVDAKFTEQDVINMFYDKHKKSRVVVVCKCFLITDGSITYEQ